MATRNRLNAQEQKKIYIKIVAQCGENSKSGMRVHDEAAMEDSVDERRGLMKHSICLSTAALVSKPNVARQYFKNARELLTNVADGKAHELLEEESSATFILEILYLREHNILKDENKKSAISAINKLSNLFSESKKPLIEVINNL